MLDATLQAPPGILVAVTITAVAELLFAVVVAFRHRRYWLEVLALLLASGAQLFAPALFGTGLRMLNAASLANPAACAVSACILALALSLVVFGLTAAGRLAWRICSGG